MPLFPIILMAIVQGLGEFLPIGASGQLVLVPTLTGWPDQGLVVDLGAHVGTLIAVLLYFWRDVARMPAGLLRLLLGEVDEGARLALQVIAASVPGIGLGYLLQRYLGTNAHDPGRGPGPASASASCSISPIGSAPPSGASSI